MESGFSVLDIASIVDGRWVNADRTNEVVKGYRIVRPVDLTAARSPDECAFFFSPRYQAELISARPGVLITGEEFVKPLLSSGLPLLQTTAVIATEDPYLSMAVLSEKFAPTLSSHSHLELPREGVPPQVHPSALVDASASLEEGVVIGPGCVVEPGVVIGRGTRLYSRVYLGPGVQVGSQCVLFPGVVLYEKTTLGDRVRIHANSVVGSDGFGYAPVVKDGKPEGWKKIYHFGVVKIGNDVEVGAGTMIDRGTFGDTIIEDGVKLDNHVHIAHNSVIGAGTLMCGAACTAGGTIIGKHVFIGGLAGIGNKAVVGDFAKIGAMSFVDKDVPQGGAVLGNPGRPVKEHFKAHALLNRMVKTGAPKKDRSVDRE